MSDADAELRHENAALRQQLADAKNALTAMARGEVDAVASSESGVPVLLHAAQQELRNSQALLRAVFDGSLDALLLANDEGVYVDANPAACELFGLPRDQLVGRNVKDFAPSAYGSEAQFQSFIAAGRMRGQFPLLRLDGTRRILEFTAVAGVSRGLHLSALRDVTDRVAAEDALRQSEVLFRAMVEKGQDGIALLGADLRTRYQSPVVERLLGYPFAEAQKMSWNDCVDEEERPGLAAAFAKLMASPGSTAALEFRARRRDGARRWIGLTATNWLDDPDIGAIVTNFRDVTERKTLEEEQEGFFRMSLDLLCIADIHGRFRRLNPAWETTLGWSLEELCARPWLEFVHPDDRPATENEEARLAAGQIVMRFENRYRCKDGSYRLLQWSSMPSSNGLIYACARDVTRERAIAHRDRLLFQENPVPMFLTDIESQRFLDANDAAIQHYGYERDELFQMTLGDLVVEEQHESIASDLRTVVATGKLFVRDRRHRTKAGLVRDVEVTRRRMEVDGRPAVLSVLIDVTDAKRLEAERARHLDRLRLLEMSVSRLNDIVVITRASPLSNPGPEIVYVNEAFERVTGYSRAEAIGNTPRMLQGPDTDPDALTRLKEALERAQSAHEELINYTKAGIPYWCDVDIAPVRNDAGELTHFVAIERDTTEKHRASDELRRSEERLRQAQKMEAIGNLAGGIAHDFNNVLTVILSCTDMIEDELAAGDPLRSSVKEIHGAGLRAADLTRQLLAFSRKQILQPSAVDVNEAVRSIEKMLGRILGEDIGRELHASPDAGRAFVDRGQLDQVIMNLVVNARDAMPEGGHLTVETSSAVLDDAYAAAHPGTTAGSYVVLAVSDTGVGMDKATQDRMFEPFFTTKGQGKGTGLGLSTVYGIVHQSGGHIEVISQLGHGTTFKVYLPRTDRVEEIAMTRVDHGDLSGDETILLVEDERPVRDVLRNVLAKKGYRVLEAENGGEALLICEQFAGTIDMLLTDVVMPRMSGRQLAERLAVLRPEMKVLYVSGYTEDTIAHHGVLDAGIECLTKPILSNALLTKLRQLLDRPRRAQ